MDFDFSDEQKALQQSARRLLEDIGGSDARRKVFESGSGLNAAVWHEAKQLGWTACSISEEDGGLGLGRITLCAIAEEVGRALAAVPFLSSIGVVAEAVSVAGSVEQKASILPGLASGERVGALAIVEGPGPIGAGQTACHVEQGRLSGTKIGVVDGMLADLVLVTARENGRVHLYLVDLADADVVRTPEGSLDPSRPSARLDFQDVPASCIDGPTAQEDLIEILLDRAAVPAAFEQIGGAQAALDLAKSYAMERYAFGRPIAAFQAIKHKLAEVHVSIELARSQAYYAAWALETDATELPIAAACARLAATAAFEHASRELIQVHGGIGMTWEHDCHLFYRRSRHLALVLGAPDQWRERLARRLLAERGRTAREGAA